ncbi:nuclear transport factor 2 family protein [Marinobacter salarius]|uniref:nuclear transport factor 2 family protein n=1 Tax=Marinobacter salarius TaxID=1420917 RepID=UPI00273B59FB|nr:nuclear transport factor 2 family protein [Marinobacter salarius]MDP4534311.1 nuclear transport factor 2 family protein [Marinobacter salarius]
MVSIQSTPAHNKEIAQTFLDIFSTGNVNAILDCLHEDATWWISGKIGGISGTYSKAEIGELLAGVTSAYKQGALPVRVLGMTAEEDRVAIEAESYAELHNGKIFNNEYHFLITVSDEKVIQVREYSDTLHIYEIFVNMQD